MTSIPLKWSKIGLIEVLLAIKVLRSWLDFHFWIFNIQFFEYPKNAEVVLILDFQYSNFSKKIEYPKNAEVVLIFDFQYSKFSYFLNIQKRLKLF